MQQVASGTAVARCGRALSIDRDTRDIIARRNVLLGLWAARVMGLKASEREAYAWSLHFADSEDPGDQDVIDKLAHDFARAGVPMRESHIGFCVKEAELRAKFQLSAQAPRRPRGRKATQPLRGAVSMEPRIGESPRARRRRRPEEAG